MKVFDLFSGIGGFSLGLQQAGMEIVGHCEINSDCQKVLRKHWPDVPHYTDVKEVTNERLKADGINGIRLLCGGFPCTDISIGGKGTGIHGKESGLWSEYRRLIDDVRPDFAVVENVSMLLSRGLSVVLGDLATIGYDATWTTFDSQYFGVPQRRRRVYILAVRAGIPEGADIFNTEGRSESECKWAVENIDNNRPWDFTQGHDRQEGFAYYTRQRSDEYDCIGLSSALLKRDYKAPTDLVLHKGVLRRVTPQERLLLQGFPSTWFDGCGLSKAAQYRCNGMTVPVVKHIGEKVLEFARGQ